MYDIENYFVNKGRKNIKRSIDLMEKAIEFFQLDLNNKVIFTEAASDEYIYTPIIAAMAGAKKVFAITKDSMYATKQEVEKDTYLFAELCKVKDNIEVVFNKDKISKADIVTNLGFVRPIDRKVIDKIKKQSVIPYMCEAWEIRKGDVDIDYCKEKGIWVMGTNENYHGLDVFNFSGPLALKMLFEAKIEVYKCKIVIVSGDKFGKVIYNTLSKINKDTVLINDLRNVDKSLLYDADAIIIADYTDNKCFIGKENCDISSKELKEICSNTTVIQFAGIVDINDLKKNKIRFYPEYEVGNFKMGKTLDWLGPKPIIDLHCAGLKVGEIMYKKKNGSFTENTNKYESLCQFIT